MISTYHTKYFAHELTRRCPTDSVEKQAGALVDAQVLSRCDWRHDDYSLKVENLPVMEKAELPKPGQQGLFDGEA